MPVQLTLIGVQWGVQKLPEGMKQLIFIDTQSGITVNVPVDDNVAGDIATELRGISIAQSMPKDPPAHHPV